jgi:hypothetical protein
MIAGGSGTGRMPPAKSIKLYEAAIAEYGEFWRSLSEEQRGAAILQVEGTHDMTAEDVQGALATLED